MGNTFCKTEEINGKEFYTEIRATHKIIVQIAFKHTGTRQNISCENDWQIESFYGTIVAIFRIKPFTGNIL